MIFPELGISGYSIDDLLHQAALLDGVSRRCGRIAAESASLSPVVVVGAPLRFEQGVFNCRGRDPPRAGAWAWCPRATCPNTASSTRSGSSAPLATRSATGSGCSDRAGAVRAGSAVRRARPAGVRACMSRSARTCGCRYRRARYAALAGATVLANLSASNITVGKAGFRRLLVRLAVRADDRRRTCTPRPEWASRRPTSPGTGRH